MQIRLLSDVGRWAGLGRRTAHVRAESIRAAGEVRAQASQYSAVSMNSLEEFYDAHAARAYGLALRVLRGDRGAAEDIVAETLVAVWQSNSRSEDAEAPDLGLMLLQRIRQRCIDVVRGRPDAVSPEEVECLSPGSRLRVPRDGVAITSEAVRSALDALSHEQLLCIERAFFQGKTSTQIDEDLGISKGLVHQAMRSGLRALAERHTSTRTEAMAASSPAPKRAAR